MPPLDFNGPMTGPEEEVDLDEDSGIVESNAVWGSMPPSSQSSSNSVSIDKEAMVLKAL